MGKQREAFGRARFNQLLKKKGIDTNKMHSDNEKDATAAKKRKDAAGKDLASFRKQTGITSESVNEGILNKSTYKSKLAWFKAHKELKKMRTSVAPEKQKAYRNLLNMFFHTLDDFDPKMMDRWNTKTSNKNNLGNDSVADLRFELKDILGKDAGKIMESVEPVNEKNYFGHNVDPTKFAAYMKFVKNNKLEEPTVRMIQQMVFDQKGKRLSSPMQYMVDRLKQDLKNPKYKQALKLWNDARLNESVSVNIDEALTMVSRKPHPTGGHIVTLKDKDGKKVVRHLHKGKVKTLSKEATADPDTVRMMKDNPHMQKKGGPGGLKSLNKNTQKKVKQALGKNESDELDEKGKGLWANIAAKKARGEKMRKKGDPGAPTDAQIKQAQGKNESVDPITELTAKEKQLVNQMYDKKGNLTPLGKKVFNHNKKPGDKGYVE
jgi:hypothetical protein